MVALRRQSREYKATSISDVEPDDDDSIVNFVMNRWQKRDQYRAQIERQWYINVAQYLGFQWHQHDRHTGRITLPRAPTWRVRLVCNRLMNISRKVVSKLLRQRPIWVVVPATNEDADHKTAKSSEKVLQYYWRYLNMDRVLVDLFTWTSTTGNAFLRVYWDPQKGPEMNLTEEISEIPDWAQQVLEKNPIVHLGDIAIEVCSPFEIDVDPEAQRMDDVTHIIHTKLRNIQYLKDRYGIQDLQPDASDENSLSRYYERRIQTFAGPTGLWETKDTDEELNSVLTHTLWCNPTAKQKNGFFAVVANGKILTKGELPNPFRRIPYEHFLEIPVPGRFWGSCALEHCIGLQAEYNRGRSQLIENRNLMGRPKWFVPRGSGVSQTSLNSMPGEVIEHTPGLRPEPWSPPEPPAYIHKLLEYTLKDMEDVSAIHEVTQARAPSGVRSGVAIAQLQEQDEQMLAPMFMLAEKSLSRIGQWALQLLATNVTEERVIKIIGKDRDIEAMTFVGKNITGTNAGKPGINYYDVETQMGSQLPLSKSSRLQFAIDLVNSRILDPAGDRKTIFRILEIGTDEPVLTDMQLDQHAQERENRLMAQGIMVEINPWDDHAVHYDTMRRFQKQPDYQEILQTNPMVNQIFENHAAQHQIQLMPPMPMQPPPGGMEAEGGMVPEEMGAMPPMAGAE